MILDKSYNIDIMQIKFINTEDLSSTIISVRGGTVEDVLEEAKTQLPNFNSIVLKKSCSVLKFDRYIGDVIYQGTPKNEWRGRGRPKKDWTDKIALFNQHYNSKSTAKIMSVKTGLPVGEVYYIAKMTDTTLAKGTLNRKH